MNENASVYLDYAAATPMDSRVLQAMLPYFTEYFYNPSSPYAPAVKLRREYEAAKSEIARGIGAKGDELIMTAGATESIAIALNSVSATGKVISSDIEHHAVIEAVRNRGGTLLPATEKGLFDVDLLKASITPETEIISVALANNELGTLQPVKEIVKIVASERNRRFEAGDKRPIYVHCDASQGLGQVDANVARLGVDMLTVNAGKIYGPKQVACLWVKPGVKVKPLINGGGQERGIRSGTENVPGVMGFAKAMSLAASHYQHESKRLAKLRDQLESALTAQFPEAIISGHKKRRLSGHLHISFPGLDAERLIFTLETKGVYVATGSACAANFETRSHVLEAIKCPADVADGSLRITLGRFTASEDIKIAGDALIEVISKEYERVRR